MLVYQTESVGGVADEIDALIWLHYQEAALHRDRIALEPDWPRYFAMEEAGVLRLFTARDEGRLVGYANFFLCHHHHFQGALIAMNDVVFLHPDFRKGRCGIELIRYCEQNLKADGAAKITWTVKRRRDFRPILHRLGYEDEEIIVSKIL